MSQLEKLLQRIMNNPKTVRFEELDKVLIKDGFVRRQSGKGTSHYVYTKEAKVLVVPFNKPYVKQIYVERAIESIDMEGREHE